jgi:hypothetical protein
MRSDPFAGDRVGGKDVLTAVARLPPEADAPAQLASQRELDRRAIKDERCG